MRDKADSERTGFFPLFVDVRDKAVLVIGGGKVSERRVKALIPFGARITVISPTATDHIRSLAAQGAISLLERKYRSGDIHSIEPLLVITATDDRQVNHEAMMEAKNLNILVSVADRREECTCYFPAVAESEKYIAGIASKDGDHKGVKQMAEKIRKWMD